MKKLLLILLAVIFITSCQKEKQRYFFDSPEIQTLKSGIKAYEAKDWEKWKANFADTAKVFINSKAGITPAERIASFDDMLSNFSSYGFDEKDAFSEMIIDKDDETWVNYWGNWKGTLVANNKEISIPVHLTVQFIDGKIVEEYGYYDTAGFISALQQIETLNNMPVEEKVIIEAINKIVEGWNKHDISNLKSLSTNNFVRTANGTVIANSVDEYEVFMKTFVTGFSDFTVKLNSTAIKDNKVYINWTCTGTNDGIFMDNSATGKKIITHGFSVWTMNGDGKFTREDAFYDNLDLFNQLGITPPKV